jgi:hypothetical protein
VTDDNERRARAIARIERRNVVRRLRGPTPAEPEIDWHARVWRPIERALDAGRNPTPKDILSAAAADPSFSEAFWPYVTDLLRGKVKPTDPPREEVKPTRGVKPQSWSVERALEEYFRFMTEEEAPKPGRLPSIDDLLGVVAANAGVPERVQLYVQQLRDGKVKATRGRRPRSNLQFMRDVSLVQTFEELREEMMERRRSKVPNKDVFDEFERRHWGGKRVWGEMTTKRDSRRPWGSEKAHSRYFEAMRRLAALRATDGEDFVYRHPE